MDIAIGYFLGALAWGAICAQVIVIPFFSKRDNLFKDLIDSGAKDLALTTIDAEKLLLALAQLIDAAIAAKAQRSQRGFEVDSEELLQQFDFQVYLDRAQAAVDEKRDIERCWDSLETVTSRLWKLGLLHVSSVVGIYFSLLVKHEFIRTVATTSTILVAAMSGIFIVWYLFKYETHHKKLLKTLGKNRGKAGAG